jgi:uncharacterized protein YndB with AHSA1/START domain
MMPELTTSPSVNVGMLIRRPTHDVFEALADPAIATRFWYTESTGRMEPGAALTWSWEMYGASGNVWVNEMEVDRRISFTHATTVEFRFTPYEDDATYLRICETGFTGDPDTQVARALDSTSGFAFLLSSLKAALEHDITLRVVLDAHPPHLSDSDA